MDLNIDENELWYKLDFHNGSHGLGNRYCWNTVYDINSDGQDEVICVFTEYLGNSYSSKVIMYRSPWTGDVLCQAYGKYSSFPFVQSHLIDVIDDSQPELILTKTAGDSVLLEIVKLEDNCFSTWTTILAATGDPHRVAKGWDDINVTALTGIDLNGDDFREVIFSRSAKPDSAFQRAIIAWDVFNEKELWSFKTADFVGPEAFHTISTDTSTFFVFTTCASANKYETNGMTSQRGYLIAIDTRGKELWRKTCGTEFFNSPLILHDLNDDGKNEIIYIHDGLLNGKNAYSELKAVDPVNGNEIISRSLDCSSRPGTIFTIPADNHHPKQIAISSSNNLDNKIFIFDSKLNLTDTLTGDLTGILMAYDLVGDSSLEIVADTRYRKKVMLDREFCPLAISNLTSQLMPYKGHQEKGIFCNLGMNGWSMVLPSKQSVASVLFARYKWWLAVFIGTLVSFGLYRGFGWINELRWLAAGRPTLDRIGALIFVLDAQGRIVFANNSPMRGKLLGTKSLRLKNPGDTQLNNFPAIIEIIQSALSNPHYPIQQRVEVTDNGPGTFMLEITTYPRLDRLRQVIGVIILIEDVSDRAHWERKAVLGEAAQRWIHKLKGNMAIARITLDNMNEDPRLNNCDSGNEFLSEYLGTLRMQINQTAETATKILRFARINKPELIESDLGMVVEEAIQTHLKKPPSGVKIFFEKEPNLPKAMIDASQITEVIDNLMSNALRTVKNKGKISVLVKAACDLRNQSERNIIEIIVEDNGCGIPKNELERIFEPGFTHFKEGTGIGLAVAKEIITNHRGIIQVQSEPGKGSVFSIKIPVRR